MREKFTNLINNFIKEYKSKNNLFAEWEDVLVGFSKVDDKNMKYLREAVIEDHHLVTDYLEDAKTMISYFVPFKESIANSNKEGTLPSDVWVHSYRETNEMADKLNDYLVAEIEKMGYRAAKPVDCGIVDGKAKSRWSQRHIAYLSGLGTFGLNNMLITEKGINGRFFSIVTNMEIGTDEPLKEERCLYKLNGSCGKCVERCFSGALRYDGFDRFKCMEICVENERNNKMADVCGKCTIGLPCTFKNPLK